MSTDHRDSRLALVNLKTLDRVQEMLASHGRDGGSENRIRHDALLRRKLRCGHCDCGMSHSFTKKGSRLYRYYICQNAQRQGWRECPTPSLPAAEVERFVVDQIATLGRNPVLLRDTLAQSRQQSAHAIETLESELNALNRQLRGDYADLGKMADRGEVEGPAFEEIHNRIRDAEARIAEAHRQLDELRTEHIEESDVLHAFENFDDLWASLTPDEQRRIVDLLIESICYDGETEDLAITYRPSGIRLFRLEVARIKNDKQETAPC